MLNETKQTIDKGRRWFKFAGFSVFILVFFITYGLVGSNEKKAAMNDLSPMVEFSSEPVPLFSESTLSQSMIVKEVESVEADREQKYMEQDQLDQENNVIYLTFDDGPSEETSRLLDLLDTYDMKATFFMMGPKMKQSPELIERKLESGHGLALHGMTHDKERIYDNPYSPAEEMLESQQILESLTGIHTEVIRLPYGSIPYLTEPMRFVLDEHDFKIWDWNVDSRDWELSGGGYVQHTIQVIQHHVQAGETPVVLLHDREETIDHLPKLLSYIKIQGFQTEVMTNEMVPLTFSCASRCHSIH